jgi:NTP pyrophosphatase (non-canonical NTP hydrolase)
MGITMIDFEQKIVNWANDRNIIDGSTPEKQLEKLAEEMVELAIAMGRKKRKDIADAIGDMNVVLAIIAEQNDLSLGYCQQMAWNEIKDRKGKMVAGKFVKEV